MCGISGVVVFNDKPVSTGLIQAMTERLSHRGPNDSGTVVFTSKGPVVSKGVSQTQAVSGAAALGHRRLSIIDVSSLGHQPMASNDGKLWIVFNGEIYNYVELRQELEVLGYSFISHTDTEVVLNAYKAWGQSCFKKFNGMWALALYDLNNRALILSRDRFGKKPLYYYFDNRVIVFASEVKALFCHPRVMKKPDLKKIANYAGRHYRFVDDAPTSFFENISQVPISSTLVFDVNGHMTQDVYWSLVPQDTLTQKFSESELVVNFRELLDDAVRLRLRSDVPVGALLSGGMDSTSIVSLAARRHPKFKTFSSVTGTGYYDESRYISEVVRKTGVDAAFIYPQPSDLFETLREMLQFHDEPVCTPTWYSMYLMIKELAKAKVPVVLTGHAGDELLAGYWDHYHHYFLDLRLSGQSDEIERQAWFNNHSRDPLEYSRERKFVEALSDDVSLHLNRYSKYFDCLKVSLRAQAGEPVYEAPYSNALDKRLYLELFRETVPASLRAEDRNCMAFSIENRVPFLDYRLVEFAFRLPGTYKIRNGLGKWLLREAMKDLLPEDVRLRKDKTGHNLPFDEWLRGDHRQEMEELLSRKGFINDEIYAIDRVREKFNAHLNGENHYMFFWQYINMHIWYEQQFMGK